MSIEAVPTKVAAAEEKEEARNFDLAIRRGEKRREGGETETKCRRAARDTEKRKEAIKLDTKTTL